MESDGLHSIGELARRTGLSVRTIRFYSDSGLVPPTGRSAAGYRLYDLDALARLDLIRTLRELGLDLATVRRVLSREVGVPEVAAAHVEALDVQIRTLRLRRAVLRAVAKRDPGQQELRMMHRLAQLSDEERRRLIEDFVSEIFDDLDANPEFVAMMRSAVPELPDDPSPAQLDAWVELAELVQDPGFRASVRRAAEYQAADRAEGAPQGMQHELAQWVRERVTRAVEDGIAPDSPAAAPVLAELVARYAAEFGAEDTPAYRARLLTRLEAGNDPRAERYWQLMATVNGWPIPPSLSPVFDWFARALRHDAAR
ncbi:MerR family transcriptional regulator [Streptomyces hoynatensis]|uniref:MerR family transcriptional regulator n=1 Tax=Streptomyces hoynatensis TaxID=1141874 RepID=A0A3A9ZGN0_9ACTN|nr:MerR family transcriptional regulator [Streptomyces hoynatensis]RKN47205.1 MerR family transcriptional regulator [Streptomyces hoynatensis]